MVPKRYKILYLGLHGFTYPNRSSLLRLMGGKPLDYIENSRLILFIERTMSWKFEVLMQQLESPSIILNTRIKNEHDPYTKIKLGPATIEIMMITCDSDQLKEDIIASARASLLPIAAVTG